MQELTEQGNQAVHQLAQRYGVSADAVRTLLQAVSAGGGTMAQFYHPELGGGGQWMQGGMTMVGDMFNHNLKNIVNGLCADLSNLLASSQVYAPVPMRNTAVTSNYSGSNNSNNWWPSELGFPSSSGGQNDARYAYFPQPRRLAIERSGVVTIYDTLDHQIGGVQQQQTGPWGSLSFSSQRGTFTVESLPMISSNAPYSSGMNQAQSPGYAPASFASDSPVVPGGESLPSRGDQSAIFSALDKLGDLHQRGVLSDDEFRTKKAELLARL
jgi:hypothetical protein